MGSIRNCRRVTGLFVTMVLVTMVLVTMVLVSCAPDPWTAASPGSLNGAAGVSVAAPAPTTSSTSTTSTFSTSSTTSTTTTVAADHGTAQLTATDASSESGGLALTSELVGSIDGESADPVLVQDGVAYLVYTTNATDDSTGDILNVPVRASFDLATWTEAIDALPVLPSWADAGYTWAPTVRRLGDVWAMYFAARDRDSGLQCIGLATSTDSNGPFTSTSSEPVVCRTELGGSIDPEVVVTDDGTAWLLWKSDGNCCGIRTSLWSAALGAYGQVTGDPTRLLTATEAWQRGIVENPTVVETEGGLVLLYSGGDWDDSSYGTGFALCSTLRSPCTNASDQPAFDDVDGSYGSGGLSVTTVEDGRTLAIWHAWTSKDRAHGRAARLSELSVG